jgi:hypothetical protein
LPSPLAGLDVSTATGAEAVRAAQVQAGAGTPDILAARTEEVRAARVGRRGLRIAPGKVSGRATGEAPGMKTEPAPPINPAHAGVNRDELARPIAEIYRDAASEAHWDLHFPTGRPLAEALGYPPALLERCPQRPSCLSPVLATTGLARLLGGESELDLGRESGMDVFAGAVHVGPQGSVDGIEITPEQLRKAVRLVRDQHVSFRRARIEELPSDTGSFDVVISNGVVNLSSESAACSQSSGPPASPGPTRELHRADIAAAGLEVKLVERNSAYRFTSDRAQPTSEKYGSHSISLLALKPIRNPTTTQEISQ